MKSNEGIELNASCSIGMEDGVYGLILESWGPANRNKDYNIALEYIIKRLIDSGVYDIKVYLISATLKKNIPNILDRSLHFSTLFNLCCDENSISKKRNELCKLQAYFSSSGRKETPSGNRTKKILINAPGINSEGYWESIVNGDTSELSKPTSDDAILNARVGVLLSMKLNQPEGNKNPKMFVKTQNIFERNPEVKAWVLKNSKGICENCGGDAPFYLKDGNPFLEVHHVIPLSSLGEDTVNNCVAVCPNCHRALHLSVNSKNIVEELYIKVSRLDKK
ncbi:TPA: HNH endonuclease [Enterobacter hormaechei]